MQCHSEGERGEVTYVEEQGDPWLALVWPERHAASDC